MSKLVCFKSMNQALISILNRSEGSSIDPQIKSAQIC